MTTPTQNNAQQPQSQQIPESAFPATDQSDTLTPDEVHELRRVVINSKTSQRNPINGIEGGAGYFIPKLEITTIDADRFAENLMDGTPYIETFNKFNGKLRVKFRVRTRKEEEAAVKQIHQDYKDGLIQTDIQHYGRTNLYNLVTQVMELDGVEMVYREGASLRDKATESIFDSMLEPKLYILVGLLAQFEDKVSRIARKALEPDFSAPAAGI